MFQLGGNFWEQFFPRLASVLIANQSAEGSWQPDIQDARFGNAYATALAVLALSTPNQILPIFQK
jgi:hypothetical protein